jgi:hypothetical protein
VTEGLAFEPEDAQPAELPRTEEREDAAQYRPPPEETDEPAVDPG